MASSSGNRRVLIPVDDTDVSNSCFASFTDQATKGGCALDTGIRASPRLDDQQPVSARWGNVS